MYRFLLHKIQFLANKQVPATGIGLFRSLYGLVTLQEIAFLLYFNHFIFDPIPFIDVEFPMIPFFLCLWGLSAFFIFIGYRCHYALIINYIFWIVFVQFTPMQRDFDGGFDTFMIGVNFFLLFMPTDRAFSIDSLRYKLSTPYTHYATYPKASVSALAYYLPTLICLGFLYFDSAIHKMFAEHWRNGLGAWLPATQPYYISALNFSWVLNQEVLQKIIGYTIMIFQFTFLFFFFNRNLRTVYLFIGLALHLGILAMLNIYPFGLGMLIFYTLLIPFSWWRKLALLIRPKSPYLTVFYDKDCPLCNRTVLIINHFDIFKCVEFKDAQTFSQNYSALNSFSLKTLLTDLYAVDLNNHVYSGIDTYIQILMHMRYTALIGWLLKIPGIYHFSQAKYRSIADNRLRNNSSCSAQCLPQVQTSKSIDFYSKIFEDPDKLTKSKNLLKLSKATLFIIFLQLNSSIHYGLIYRLHINTVDNPVIRSLAQASNSLLMISQTFIGITPHALYLHDHFSGYNKLLAITYITEGKEEQWIPFINSEGRILAPNWGRVHSMWANIAVTPKIDETRLSKAIMRTTAFWGKKLNLDLSKTRFNLVLKSNSAPTHWVHDQLRINLNNPWRKVGYANWSNNKFSLNLASPLIH